MTLKPQVTGRIAEVHFKDGQDVKQGDVLFTICLLYTSDAADERSSVDLGGRRIIKKKKRINYCRYTQASISHVVTDTVKHDA